ncbi:hypothetical protein Tco_0948079 [Tanacetum coccineum]
MAKSQAGIFVYTLSHKNIFRNIRRVGKGFYGRDTPLFPIMMVQAQQEQGEGLAMPTDPQHTPTIIQPSTSQPQKKQKPRKPKRKDTEVPQPSGPTTNVVDEAVNEEMDGTVWEKECMTLSATSLDDTKAGRIGRVLDLENTKTAQAQEITSLKLRVKKLEKKGGSRTHKLKRLYKVGRSVRVISSDEASLGDQEDASKQGRKINDIDKDVEFTLVDETQGRYGDENMFGVNDLEGDEVIIETEVASKDVNLTVDEVTLAQALAALKSAKPKADKVMLQEPEHGTITTTTAATTITAASIRTERLKGCYSIKISKIVLRKELAFKPQAGGRRRKGFQRKRSYNSKKGPTLLDRIMVQGMIEYMDTELVKGSEVRAEKESEVRAEAEIAQKSSSKRAGTELE